MTPFLSGRVLPVVCGVLLGVAFVTLHGAWSEHPHPHAMPPLPPVLPVHFEAVNGRLHLLSQPQPQLQQPGRVDFSHQCACPRMAFSHIALLYWPKGGAGAHVAQRLQFSTCSVCCVPIVPYLRE